MKVGIQTTGMIAPQQLDFSRWAVVAHNDDSGLGRQAAGIRSVLGLGHHLVVPSERLVSKPLGRGDILLDPAASAGEVRESLRDIEGIIFFERNNWHPQLLPIARSMGVKTICVPNWEWFRGEDKLWSYCDFFICPTRFTLNVLHSYGWTNSIYLPWTLDLNSFAPRRITGPGRLFVHNAGLVDNDDRKGTRDTIEAFKRVPLKNIRLLVRLQRPVALPELDDRITVRIGNLRDPSELYAEGDVAIQPSKMEGIGFMVLEPVCSGLPVITTDYPPMNEFVQHHEMLAKKQWFKRRAFATNWVKHAHLRIPQRGDLARKIQWCAEHDLSAISAYNRDWAERTFNPDLLREEWRGAFEAVTLGAIPEYVRRRAISA